MTDTGLASAAHTLVSCTPAAITRTITSKAPGSGTSTSSTWKASVGSPKRSSRMTQAAIVAGSSPGSVSTVWTCVTSTAMLVQNPLEVGVGSLRGANHTPEPPVRDRSLGVEEAPTLEQHVEGDGAQDHAADAVAPEGRRRVDVAHEGAEVLAEEAGDEGQRQEDRRDHGELRVDVAEAVGDRGEIDVQRAGEQVAVGVDELGAAQQVVVDVAEPVAGVVGLQAGQPAEHLAAAGQDVALGRHDAPQLDELAAHAEEVLALVGARALDHRVHERVDLLVHPLQHWEERVGQRVHDAVDRLLLGARRL